MLVAFIFCILILRLFYLQTLGSYNLQIKAVEQWVRMLPLTAKRGQIVDRNGNILAISYTSYDVYVRGKEVKDANEVTAFLCNTLGLSYDSTFEKVKDNFISESLVKLQIDENTALKIVKKDLDGVYVSENIYRFYPYKKLASQVVGYLTSDSIGQSGIENFYEKILSGTDGKYLTQSDVRGITLNDSLKYYVEAIDGLNLKLTLDINIQNIVESVIENIIRDHNPKSVSAIVLDPLTSEILAMAVSPSFDLNDVPREDVSQLMELTKNTTVTDVYEPGSTFKVLTLAAALAEGLTSLDERFYCSGSRVINGEKIKCWKSTGHGSQTLIECVQNSCNCCFMDLALRLGPEKLYKYLKAFGIGTPTGVDIFAESSGLMLDESLVRIVDVARIGFGQSVAVTQLQLINSFCSIINGGTLYQPTLLKSYYDNSGNVLFENINLIANSTVSEATSQTVSYLLEKALSKTGEMTFVPGYSVAGKTGTAQKYGSDGKISKGKYVSSFFGYLQLESPQYSLLICVDEPSSGAYYGSIVAKPYAKQIFEKIITYKNIPLKAEVKIETVVVPDLISKSLSYAIVELERLKVYYEIDGDGGKIVGQFPSPGTVIQKASSTILLKTD